MKPLPCSEPRRRYFLRLALVALTAGSAGLCTLAASADELELRNGDRYSGKVLAYTNNVVLLTNDFIGKVSIPRTNVTRMLIGAAPTNSPLLASKTNSGVLPKLPAKSLAGAITNLDKSTTADQAAQVKQQLLGDADPAAKAKFDAMLGDLMSGKMSMGDLRAQAVSAATQLRQLKKEMGPQADDTLDGYLSVLESFIKEVPPDSPVTRTNNAVVPVPGKTGDD